MASPQRPQQQPLPTPAPAAPKSKQPELKSSSANVFLPAEVTEHDYFRMKRQGIGWVVEMVRVTPEHRREVIWAEDLVGSTERRLIGLAMDAAR